VNKKLFILVFVLLGIVLLGIILVQLLWIRGAIRVKEEQFDRSVNYALHNVVEQMETYENYVSIANKLKDPQADTINFFVSEDPKILTRIDYHDSTANFKYVISSDYEANINVMSWHGTDDAEIILEDNFDIAQVEVKLDTIGIGDGDHDMVFITKKGYDEDSLYVISNHQVIRIKKKAKQLEEVFERMVVELESEDEPIEKRVDLPFFKKKLSESLNNQNINLPYEFAIFAEGEKENIKLRSEGFSDAYMDTKYRVNLFPTDIFDKSNLLKVAFPGKKSHLYRSLGWLLAGSGLFTIFMIITFSLTLYLILRQKKISEIKSDFINNMTHEFKTPIATISLAADSISIDKTLDDRDQIMYFLRIIKEENMRMNKQVENVLQMALLEKQDFALNFEPLDIHDLIRNAVSNVSLQVEKRDGKIDTELNALNPVLYTDKIHFTNVIYNLLDNACKYSDKAPEISVTTENNDNGVIISVEDNGIGMTIGTQQKIFDKFYRTTSGNIHNVKGFGLGLSYVKAILDLNKGTISVKSEVGKGSKFTVFLPYKL